MKSRALRIRKQSFLVFGTATVSFSLAYLVFVANSQPAYAIPAFARKYNLPCSACHEAAEQFWTSLSRQWLSVG